jgi:hypothetical protein
MRTGAEKPWLSPTSQPTFPDFDGSRERASIVFDAVTARKPYRRCSGKRECKTARATSVKAMRKISHETAR